MAQVTQEMVDFLTNNQWSDFYKSLLAQVSQRGTLSDKQVGALTSAMQKAQVKDSARQAICNSIKSEFKVGDFITVRAWLAEKMQKDLNLPYFFRNLEIVEVHAISYQGKGIQMSFRFSSNVAFCCHVCGRALDSDISKATGIGPVCASRLGVERPTLENAQKVLVQIEEKAVQMGVIGPVWVPVSQIIKDGGLDDEEDDQDLINDEWMAAMD